MIDHGIFDLELLVKNLLGYRGGHADWRFVDCEIIPQYMPPYPDAKTRPACVVRHIPTGSFLRYSKGPRQGHFWDVYGDDYMTPELALLALMQAPARVWPKGSEPGTQS